jgi:hypothetical protein
MVSSPVLPTSIRRGLDPVYAVIAFVAAEIVTQVTAHEGSEPLTPTEPSSPSAAKGLSAPASPNVPSLPALEAQTLPAVDVQVEDASYCYAPAICVKITDFM